MTILEELIEKHIDKPWRWCDLSNNPSITQKIY